jgi:hypothetical protein
MAKAQPGNLNYGSAGNGQSGHLASELFKLTTRIDVVHVPYKGGSPALTDLMGGRLSFMIINPIEVVSNIKSGRLRALAVANPKRIAMLPDVPTFAEAGVPGYDASVWWGLVAPAKTPRDIVNKLSSEALKALQDEGVKEKLSNLGAVIDPAGPEQFGRFLREEIDKWAGVIRTAESTPIDFCSARGVKAKARSSRCGARVGSQWSQRRTPGLRKPGAARRAFTMINDVSHISIGSSSRRRGKVLLSVRNGRLHRLARRERFVPSTQRGVRVAPAWLRHAEVEIAQGAPQGDRGDVRGLGKRH